MLEVTASEFYNNIWQFLPSGKHVHLHLVVLCIL